MDAKWGFTKEDRVGAKSRFQTFSRQVKQKDVDQCVKDKSADLRIL